MIGGLCGGIFIDEAFEGICKNALGRRWNKLSQTGIKEIMKNEWEYAIKPQYTITNSKKKEYIVAIPAEAFVESDMNDESKKPIIKEGRIYFTRYAVNLQASESIRRLNRLCSQLGHTESIH